jgi:uncharacterized protein (DUF362 family)
MKQPKTAALVKGDDRKDNINKCLNLITQDLNPIKEAKSILIKPNLVALKPDYANTNVKAIEAVIEFILEFCGDENKQITVGEAGATAFYNGLPTTKVFADYGYYALEKKYSNVVLTDFDNDTEFVKAPIQSVVGDTHLRLVKRALEFDYKISLSIPKTHNFAQATFGIKNMAGLVTLHDMATIHGMKGGIEVGAPKTLLDYLPAGTVSRARRTLPNWLINLLFRQYPAYRKSVKMIHHNIVSFAKLAWPDLVVLDGFVAMEGDGPVDGMPVDLRAAVASTDPLKADGIGARIIGFEPSEIGYLYYLHEREMGDYSLNNLVGDDINEIKRVFKRHGTYDIQKEWV